MTAGSRYRVTAALPAADLHATLIRPLPPLPPAGR